MEGSEWRAALHAGAPRSSPLQLGGLNHEAVYELASASIRLVGERPLERSPLSPTQRSPPPAAAPPPRLSAALPQPEPLPLPVPVPMPMPVPVPPSSTLHRSSTLPHSPSEVTASATSATLYPTPATSTARARTSPAVRASAPPLAPVMAAGAPTASAASAAKQTPLSALQELFARGISGEQLFYLALGSVLSIGAFLLLLLALLCCVLHRNSSRRRQLKRLKRRLSSSNSIATTQAAASVPLLRHYKTLSPSNRPNGISYANSNLNCTVRICTRVLHF